MCYFRDMRRVLIIGTTVALLITAIPLAVYFYHFNGGISNDFSNWAAIGSIISGFAIVLLTALNLFQAIRYASDSTRHQQELINVQEKSFQLSLRSEMIKQLVEAKLELDRFESLFTGQAPNQHINRDRYFALRDVGVDFLKFSRTYSGILNDERFSELCGELETHIKQFSEDYLFTMKLVFEDNHTLQQALNVINLSIIDFQNASYNNFPYINAKLGLLHRHTESMISEYSLQSEVNA